MPDFNVLMMGARRTGKTSVLASMKDSFHKAIEGANLILTTDVASSMYDLSFKMDELTSLFNCKDKTESFMVDLNGTYEEIFYDFNIGVSGAGPKSQYSIRFTDIPGEFLMGSKDRVDELIEESQVVIVAVDSTHLMEEFDSTKGYGKYHEVFNSPNYIREYFQNSIITQEGHARNRLILFVPIKCEKYYHQGRMDELNSAVKKGYSETFAFFANGNIKDYCAIAITPILTLGDVVFDYFGRDEEGRVIVHDKTAAPGLPFRPKHVYYRFRDSITARFSPQFCEQPIVYLLMYILKEAMRLRNERRRNRGSILLDILKRLFSIFKRVEKDDRFQQAIYAISSKMKRTGDGYEIVQNPLNI